MNGRAGSGGAALRIDRCQWRGSCRTREVGQGEVVVSADPDLRLTATLGSCVAVIFFDPLGRIGGLTHIFQCVDPGPAGGAAVVAEIERLVNAFMHEGSPRSMLEARVIGGAYMLGRGRDVGHQITQVVLEFLRTERIRLVDSDVGGTRARRLTFSPGVGGLHVSYPGNVPVAAVSEPPKPRDRTEFF